jgi:hypothetical protein
MKKNHIFIYNKQVSLVSSNAGEISTDSELKNIIAKSKLPSNLITKKLQLDKIKRIDLDSKKNIDNSINSMNKLNTKRTHLPEELNNNNDKEEKNNDIDSIYNKSKKPEIIDDNIYKNISVRKGKIQKTINIFSNKKNKNITIYPIDSMKENMIDNNKKNKEKFHKKNDNDNDNDNDNFNLDNIYGSEREL